MTREQFYDIIRIPLGENSADTQLAVGDLDAYHNLHQKEWFQYVDSMGLFLDRFPNIPSLEITTAADDNDYQYLNASKFSANSTTGSATPSGGITSITDTAHTAFIATDHIAPGDRVYYSSTYYDIVEVSATTIKIADSAGAVTGTITYNVRSRPLFPIIVQFRDSSATDIWWEMNRRGNIWGRGDYAEINERKYGYTTNGEYLNTFPNMAAAGIIKVTYAPYPVPFSSYISSMTNPFGFEDDVTEAYAYFLAAKYFDDKPGEQSKVVQKNMARATEKLNMIKSAGPIAWGGK